MKARFKILFFILALIILFLVGKFFGKEIQNTFHLICSPLEKYLYEAGENSGDFFKGLLRVKKIETENQDLKKANFKLLFELEKLEGLEKENADLRKALDLKREKGFELEITEVVSKDSADFLTLNKGKENGISENMPVITPEGVLIGKTEEVLSNFSFVKLITFPGQAFEIKIADTLGKAEGKGDLNLEFDLVPKDKEIVKGDKVFTVGLTKIYPKGLLVGEVEKVENNPAEAFQKGSIVPYLRELSLNRLFIITNFSQ